jgi:glucose-6-phosphate isomerase
MKDLKATSGLTIGLDDKGMIVFEKDVKKVRPGVRRLVDIKNVLMDPEAKGPEELYHMYRDVYEGNDVETIRANNLRYDITVIKPGKIGQEFMKTAGHYHPMVEGTEISYPEVYEVLSGKAIYILQKMGENAEDIEDIIVVEVEAGEQVCIPPNYGHVTVNPGEETLVMCNWVGDGWSSTYDGITKVQGAAVYAVEKDGKVEYVKNPKCKIKGEIKHMKALDIEEFGLKKNVPMYNVFMESPEKFKFLREPEKFMDEFDKVLG